MADDVVGVGEDLMQLRSVLSIMSSELKELSKNIDQVQVALSPILKSICFDAQSHRDIQSLDIVSQKLSSLSCYACELNKALPEDFMVDTQSALSFISVFQLKENLKGVNQNGSHVHFMGDLEIF